MTKAQVQEAIAEGQSFFFGSGDSTMEEAQETIAAFAELLAEAEELTEYYRQCE